MAHETTASADVLLSDGRVAAIRPANADDHAELLALHLRASDRSRWLRFFTTGTRASEAYVAHLRTSTTTMSYVAEVSGALVGLGTAEAVDPDVEEVAFLVDDAWQGRGVASHLLEHLAADARARGVNQLTATVLTENHQMLAVFLDSGFRTTKTSSGGVVTVMMDSSATADYLEAMTAREASSERASLAPLLTPRSVAMVGVRPDGSGVGAAVLRSVVAGGYAGSLCAVGPVGEPVTGLVTSRTFRELDPVPDLAIVAVPGRAALAAVTEAATAGVGAALVLSSGSDVAGRRGAELRNRMVRVARGHGMRLVGPDSWGVVLNEPALRVNATFQLPTPAPGGLAIATHSGGVGLVLMDAALRRSLGVRYFISLGDHADVSSTDLLSAWRDDPEVTVGALHLDSFDNPGSFVRLAHSFSQRKPLLAVFGDRWAGSVAMRAALPPDAGAHALFSRAGVVECLTADEMVHTGAVFAEQPRPVSRRLGILTSTHDLGVLACQAADRCGLTVPRLPHATRERLSRLLHDTSRSNPAEVWPASDASQVAQAAAVLLGSDEVDALLVVLVGTEVLEPEATVREVSRVRRAHPDKPVLVVPLGGLKVPPDARCSEGRPGLTELPTVEAAVRALAHVNWYQEWRRLPPVTAPSRSGSRIRTARERARSLLSSRGEGWLDPEAADSVVGPFGVMTAGTVVRGLTAALDEAERIGYPVAVKVATAGVVRRTEPRLGRARLADKPGTVEAVRALAAASGTSADRVCVRVQPVRPGVELTMGIVRPEMFGPLVTVTTGGIDTDDNLADRTFLMPPFDVGMARTALQSPHIAALLRGHRGTPPVDDAAVSELVVSLGLLALEVPEVAELDLDPVLASSHGVAVVDMRLRIATPAGVNDGSLRQLRPRA